MIDNVIMELEGEILLEKNKKHTIEIVVDRLVIDEKNRSRMTDSVETALNYGKGLINIYFPDTGSVKLYSENYFCQEHDISFGEVEPRMFSFNAPYGACPECSGLGDKL